MSFSLQSHYLLCQKNTNDGSYKYIFYYDSSSGGIVELELSELRSGTKDLSNPETYIYKLTDENNTEYVFAEAEGRKSYTLNKITGQMNGLKKNRKGEWEWGRYYGYCNFVSTIKLPADSNQ